MFYFTVTSLIIITIKKFIEHPTMKNKFLFSMFYYRKQKCEIYVINSIENKSTVTKQRQQFTHVLTHIVNHCVLWLLMIYLRY